MTDRLAIASQIAAGIFSGIPYGIDHFEQTDEIREGERKTTIAIARLSLMMADELIHANNNMGCGKKGCEICHQGDNHVPIGVPKG